MKRRELKRLLARLNVILDQNGLRYNHVVAQLIEEGFEYVCEHERLKFFRKRK